MPSESKYKKSTIAQLIEDIVDPELLSLEMGILNTILKTRKITAEYLIETERYINLQLEFIKMPWAKSVKLVFAEHKTVIVHLKKDDLGCVKLYIADNDENIEPGILAIE